MGLSGSGRGPARGSSGRGRRTGAPAAEVMVLGAEGCDDARDLRQLEVALETPDTVFMLVLGDDERAARIVAWAAPLCAAAGGTGRAPARRVVWVRDPGRPAVGVFLAMLLWLPLPRVAVVNSREWVKVRIAESEPIDEEVLARAFRRG
jgi:hypothetical protein